MPPRGTVEEMDGVVGPLLRSKVSQNGRLSHARSACEKEHATFALRSELIAIRLDLLLQREAADEEVVIGQKLAEIDRNVELKKK